MCLTISIVFPLVVPPAPYGTDTKDGSSWRSSPSASRRFCSPTSVLGGKNSNEHVGPSEDRISSMRIRELCSPALGLAGDPPRAVGDLQVAQHRERLGQQPLRGHRREVRSVYAREDLEGRQWLARLG